jgi:hypothetical protein
MRAFYCPPFLENSFLLFLSLQGQRSSFYCAHFFVAARRGVLPKKFESLGQTFKLNA